MKRKVLRWSVYAGILVVALSIGALAQNPVQGNFSGLINDYTPGTVVSPVGPWEVRGEWSLMVTGVAGADFSATLTMVRSDYWIVLNPSEQDLPQDRIPHTHYVRLVDGVVTPITNGFEVTGTATITGNGSPAAFSPSPLTIDITGGSSIRYSNIKMTFGSPASGHFGTYPLDGVVRVSPQ